MMFDLFLNAIMKVNGDYAKNFDNMTTFYDFTKVPLEKNFGENVICKNVVHYCMTCKFVNYFRI